MKSLYKYQREHYRKITVKRELYEHLKKLARERGKTIPDLIKDLIDTYIGGYIGGNIVEDSDIRHNIQHNIRHNTEDEMSRHIAQSGAKSRKSAFDIFMERGYTFLSDLAKSKSVKYPERLYESIKHSAVESGVKLVEVKTDDDRILLKAEKWGEFKDKLAKIKSPDEREVFTALREDWERKLFTALSKAGAIYFHAKNKEWVYDYTSIEELRGEM
jgi:predicted DNA-binding protein